jgi:hypothetical protein
MACGGCGGGKGRKLRTQQISKSKAKPQKAAKVQRVRRRATRPVSIARQRVEPHARCPSCGYPTMLVNIGGRERQQCSNANCRQIIK